MKLTVLCAAVLLAGSASLAVAQQEPPPAPPPAPPGGMMGMMPEGHPPMRMRMGHAGPPLLMKGFDLRIGRSNNLRVNCGDEPMMACIQAVQPLIDRVSGGTPPPPTNP